jgi:protein ImuA
MAANATAQETLFALREQIARLEGKALPAAAAAEQARSAAQVEKDDVHDDRMRLPFGIPVLDEALNGGLQLDSITEIRSLSLYDAGAASGFVLSLVSRLKSDGIVEGPMLWIADAYSAGEAGVPHIGGIRQFGLDPHGVFHASPRRLDDALWLAEAALTSRAFAATILEIHDNPKSFGLTESRRLNLRAKAAGRPLFLLRHAGDEEASSASFRLLVEPAPALERRLPDGTMLGGSIGHPVFQLTLEKSRNPAPLSFLLEWNPSDRQFYLAHETDKPAAFHSWSAHPSTSFPIPADRQDRPQAVGAVLAFERAS